MTVAGNRDLPVQVGDVLLVAEPDYAYGAGPLRLRITKILDVVRQTDGPWLNMLGNTIFADGREGLERPVAVRFGVLAAAKRAGVAK